MHTIRTACGSFFTMTNKSSRNINEQISLLKCRGMLFQDESAAKNLLKSISYYRLKGYWWDMQRDSHLHIFNSGTYFEDVVERYEFDRELRVVLFYAIEIIEIALRTKLIYHLSQSYGSLWYLDSTLFTDFLLFEQQRNELQDEFARSGEIFVKDFKRKHPTTNVNPKIWESPEHPDAWLILEVATFGSLSKMYKNLKHQLPQKSAIAKEFGLNLHNELSSWLESISYLRNIVAHHSRVWSRTMVKTPMRISNPCLQWLQINLTKYQEKRPFFVISTMLYLCNAVNPENLFKRKLLDLFAKYPNIPLHKLGFNNQWQQENIWE